MTPGRADEWVDRLPYSARRYTPACVRPTGLASPPWYAPKKVGPWGCWYKTKRYWLGSLGSLPNVCHQSGCAGSTDHSVGVWAENCAGRDLRHRGARGVVLYVGKRGDEGIGVAWWASWIGGELVMKSGRTVDEGGCYEDGPGAVERRVELEGMVASLSSLSGWASFASSRQRPRGKRHLASPSRQ